MVEGLPCKRQAIGQGGDVVSKSPEREPGSRGATLDGGIT
ncbi:uncharacterized protein G2W53_016697 [Senna tora]|uniref:Uncharacterized protein n=1 Tax=Senna tora TaxID=362788 RepID=A0A834TNH7_9FABA|nr:uncharacterized protein G2W53_016697 [Senna tora]